MNPPLKWIDIPNLRNLWGFNVIYIQDGTAGSLHIQAFLSLSELLRFATRKVGPVAKDWATGQSTGSAAGPWAQGHGRGIACGRWKVKLDT